MTVNILKFKKKYLINGYFFQTLAASKFLWGYDDPIVDNYKTLATFTGEKVIFEKFGMISNVSENSFVGGVGTHLIIFFTAQRNK